MTLVHVTLINWSPIRSIKKLCWSYRVPNFSNLRKFLLISPFSCATVSPCVISMKAQSFSWLVQMSISRFPHVNLIICAVNYRPCWKQRSEVKESIEEMVNVGRPSTAGGKCLISKFHWVICTGVQTTTGAVECWKSSWTRAQSGCGFICEIGLPEMGLLKVRKRELSKMHSELSIQWTAL